MRLLVLIALTALVSVGLGCGSGGTSESDPVPETLRLGLGHDFHQSTGSAEIDLPADFFFPGSQPFSGTVDLAGEPLGTRGAFELGTTDTVVQRLGDIVLPDLPSTDTVSVELVELSLVGVQPITVGAISGAEAWDVSVTLSDAQSPALDGVLQITRDADDGGTYTAQLPVVPKFVFTRLSDQAQREHTPGEVVLEGLDDTWQQAGTCQPFGLDWLVPGFCSSISLASATFVLDLEPAAADPGRPGPASVSPQANVDPNVGSLGRGCTIEADVQIGAGAVIGPGALVGQGATIGPGACIGENAIIGAGARIGDGAVVGDGAEVGVSSEIGADGAVGPGSTVGDGCVLGQGTRLGLGCVLGPGCTLGSGVAGGDDLQIGARVLVDDDLHLASEAVIGDDAVITESLVTCVSVSGQRSVVPESQCGSTQDQATILELIRGFRSPLDAIAPPGLGVTRVEPGDLPPGLQGLVNDIGSDVAPPKNGGTGQPYKLPEHDCDDFAEEMRAKLHDKDYRTTFTVVFDINLNYQWWNPLSAKLINGHAITDVHTGDGSIVWIEPQLVGAAALNINRTLDDDNNGRIEFTTGVGTKATDGNKRIEVYDSALDAQESGRKLD